MKRIAVLSDSHGNAELTKDVLAQLETQSIDLVFHLGDDYKDGRWITDAGYSLIQVPGTWTPEYFLESIENRRLEIIEGWRMFLTHTPEHHFNDLVTDVWPEQVLEAKACELFLHGHTHHPKVETKEGITILNPGHLKHPVDRGHPASYAILDITPTTCEIWIHPVYAEEPLTHVILQKTL